MIDKRKVMNFVLSPANQQEVLEMEDGDPKAQRKFLEGQIALALILDQKQFQGDTNE